MLHSTNKLFAPYKRHSIEGKNAPHVMCHCISCDAWRIEQVKLSGLFRTFEALNYYNKVFAWKLDHQHLRTSSFHDNETFVPKGVIVTVVADDWMQSSQWRAACVIVLVPTGLVIVQKRNLMPA